ncbi:MAG: hypothetical protein AABX93_03910 [Nanoarchaeota archaeon]
MNLKEKIKLGASIMAGASAIYASEKFGLSDLVVNYEIYKASFFGEQVKNIAEQISPVGRIIYDFGIGSASSLLTFAGLNYKNSK